MKIGIDTRVLETAAGKRGIGNYTFNILKNILNSTNEFNFIFYSFYKQQKPKRLLLPEKKYFKIFTLYRPRRIVRFLDFWYSFFWKKALISSKPDLLHITHLFEWYYLSVPKNIKTIITIYDLIPFVFRNTYLKKQKDSNWYLNRLNQIKYAKKIITISEYSKKDIIKYLKVPENKISVIYCGLDDRFKKINKLQAQKYIKNRYNISSPFLLSVSAHSPHKNSVRLFDAFKQLLTNKNFKDYKLVVICNLIDIELRDWENIIRNLQLSDQIILTNFIPDNDMPYFYAASQLLVFPSLYEGFGLPILESMACGTPVLSSNTSSMPEVGGKAALYVNPFKTELITEGIIKILKDKRLQNEMIEKGLNQAKKFNWQTAAEKTLKVYSEALRDT